MEGLPPLPPIGDLHEDVTYAAVGYALSQWETAETQLCWLTGAFMGLPRGDWRVVQRYSHHATFQGRANALEAAACAYWPTRCDQALEGRFLALMAEARSLSERRNEIAHGVVTVLREWQATRSQEWCLVPALYDRRKVEPPHIPTYIYVANDIRVAGHRFLELSNAAHLLTLALEVPHAS